VHVLKYCVVLLQSMLRDLLGMTPRILDTRFRRAPVRLPIRVAAGLLGRGLATRSLRPAGHSVTAVYRKRSP